MIPEPFDYEAPWWQKLSRRYREEKEWRCEECTINLENHTGFLDTHHLRGGRYNNVEDLKALCVECHAQQMFPVNHSFMKDTQRYQDFVELVNKGVLKRPKGGLQ